MSFMARGMLQVRLLRDVQPKINGLVPGSSHCPMVWMGEPLRTTAVMGPLLASPSQMNLVTSYLIPGKSRYWAWATPQLGWTSARPSGLVTL